MQNIQDILSNNRFKKTLAEPEKKYNLTTAHQVNGVFYAKKLGATKPSEFSQVIRFTKLYPQLVPQAFSFCIDYPNAKSLLRLFFWKMNQLKVANPRGLEINSTQT